MGSGFPHKLPKIDFSAEGLVPGNHVWEVVREQVRAALETYGCFEAVYDGIPLQIREELFVVMKELFALPLELKQQKDANYIGNMAITHESLGFFDPYLSQAAHSFTHLMWPEGNPRFCETVDGYAKKMTELAQTVRKMAMESLGLEKYYQSQMETTRIFLRFVEYRSTDSLEAKIGLPPHVDHNIGTIIYQNEVRGLELQNKDGDWIPFDPSGPNSFIFMNGASFRAWSNGTMHAPPHQVKHSVENKTRYSVLLSMVPKDDVVIEAPEELIDEDHPKLFRPFKYVEFHNYAVTPGRPSTECHLTAFCGVQGMKA